MKRSKITFSGKSFPQKQNREPDKSSQLPYRKGMMLQDSKSVRECVGGRDATCNYATFLHAENFPAIIYDDGDFFWFKYGVVHCDKGPAVKTNGDLYWYQNGVLHREDGPAIERQNGEKEWFLNGVKVEEKKEEETLQ